MGFVQMPWFSLFLLPAVLTVSVPEKKNKNKTTTLNPHQPRSDSALSKLKADMSLCNNMWLSCVVILVFLSCHMRVHDSQLPVQNVDSQNNKLYLSYSFNVNIIIIM